MNSQIQGLLDTVPVAGLATINADGTPWATALHFAHDGQYLYWFSSDQAIHSLNIAHRPKVSLTIWSPDESQGLSGVYLQSSAEKIADRKGVEEAYLIKFGAIPAGFSAYEVYRAPLGQIDSVKSSDQLWYMEGK